MRCQNNRPAHAHGYPVGHAAGNWLEIKETFDYLEKGPTVAADLHQLVLSCASHLLQLTGRANSISDAERQAADCLRSGRVMEKWEEMLVAQGADLKACRAKLKRDAAPVVLEVRADRGGFVRRCDARGLGEIIRDLGGGRLTKDSTLQYEVGIDQLAKPGEPVKSGSTLLRIHAMDRSSAEQAAARVAQCIEIGASAPPPVPLIEEIIGR
jgi:thymidine phosphorylase